MRTVNPVSAAIRTARGIGGPAPLGIVVAVCGAWNCALQEVGEMLP
jgi:hypothetical protein